MAKISADTPGLHSLNQDYNRSGLGKFGGRDVKIDGVKVHLRSSDKPSAIKRLFSRMADALPGNNGKVRSYNRAQKEFSRQLGDTLARITNEGHKGEPEKLVRDLKRLNSLANEMSATVKGFDGDSALRTRLGIHLGKLPDKTLYNLLEGALNQDVDATSKDAGMQALAKDMDPIGLSQFSDLAARSVSHEMKACASMMETIKEVVVDHCAGQAAAKTGISMSAAKAIIDKGGKLDDVKQWHATGIRMPALTAFLNSNVSIQDAIKLNRGGKLPSDTTALTGPPLSLSRNEALDILQHGFGAAELQTLTQSGLSQQETVEYASAGVTLALKTSLEAKGRDKGEILALGKAGLTHNEATSLGEFRHTQVATANTAKATGGGVNETYKVKVPRGNATETFYFSKASNDLPDNASSIFKSLNPKYLAGDQIRLGDRNVASYKLDQLIGANIVAKTDYASLKGANGEIMVGTAMKEALGKAAQDIGKAPGKWLPSPPVYTNLLNGKYQGDMAKFNAEMSERGIELRTNTASGQLEFTNLDIVPHDIAMNDPALRKQMILMQYMDVLSGQADRSSRNYFVGRDVNGNVVVTAIDNDLAWGTHPSDAKEIADMADSVLQMQARGLPPIADQSIMQMFNTMTANDLALHLGDQLSPEQLSAAQGRLQAIKDHLGNLKPSNVVASWGTAADNIFDNELDNRNCYLKRDEMYFKPAPQTATQASTPQPTVTSNTTPQNTGVYVTPDDL